MEIELEMENDMDIPLPEELEWLESNALLPEEEECEDFYPEEELSKASPTISDLPAPENQTSRKRTLEVSDKEFAETLHGKKTKIPDEVETDEDWLRYSPRKNSERHNAVNAVEKENVVPEGAEERVIYRFASEIDGDCFPVTGTSGDRVYAKMALGEMSRGRKASTVERPLSGLISEPINVLMERVDQEAFEKVLESSNHSTDDSIQPKVLIDSERLWVDKYAPNSFTELLSDEQTNREVLLWLKQWDSYVFGSQIRATADDVLSALRRHSSLAQQQKFSESKRPFNRSGGASFGNQISKQPNGLSQGDASSKSISELCNKNIITNNSPEHKVLLLCGPPGLGKTTLAHVAAKHCGYRVVEINASDDRSFSVIESKILDAVQMNSVLADSKPNCLVIDEIDGSLADGKGAVEVILKMLSAEKRSVSEELNSQKASSRKGLKSVTLSRPVICICNDVFAPALRTLRQVAKVHSFVRPTVSRVANRLKYICNKESFRTSSIALTTLVEYTECDIRSCLNTLQFLNKKKETLSTLDVGSQVIGRKDMSKSVIDVWKEVFQKKKAKHQRKFSNAFTSEPKDFDFLYSLISNCGDYELTMDGIHENLLQLHYHDPMMRKTVKCLNGLGVSDSISHYSMKTQQPSLYVYQPCIATAIHSLVAQVQKPNIQWPKSYQRYRAMLMEKKDVLKVWANKISPSISRHLTVQSFVEDVISPLLHVLSPPALRPVALQLLSEKEKDDLAQLVDTMVSYSITYKNMRFESQASTQRKECTSDTSALFFDPPISDFVNFKGYNCGHPGLSLAQKQVLVHEVEKQKILREAIGKPIHPIDMNRVSPSKQSAKPSSSTENPWKVKASANSTARSCHSTSVGVKLKAPQDSKRPIVGTFDFFDRFRKPVIKSSQNPEIVLQKSATSERDLRPLLFKYNEGFTNAVKRPVRIRDLLL